MLPLYEAKMFHQFDHRWATYEGTEVRDTTLAEKRDAKFKVLPRYWVAEEFVDEKLKDDWDNPWLLAFRDIARSTDERTMIASVLPRTAVGNKAPVVRSAGTLVLQALWSSFAFDYVARQKQASTSMNFFIVKQLPVLKYELLGKPASWDDSQTLREWIESRVKKLAANAEDASAAPGATTVPWDEHERTVIRAELDAAFLILFGANPAEAEHILDSFPIVRRKEWIEHGRFVTKERVLAAYAALMEAMTSGSPYVSPLTNSEGVHA